ncbi:hypothetical protein DKT68_27295, partial [Micromonospora acroterricola]
GAISHVFLWAGLFTIAIPVRAWFIKEIPLRTANVATPHHRPTPRLTGERETPRRPVGTARRSGVGVRPRRPGPCRGRSRPPPPGWPAAAPRSRCAAGSP